MCMSGFSEIINLVLQILIKILTMLISDDANYYDENHLMRRHIMVNIMITDDETDCRWLYIFVLIKMIMLIMMINVINVQIMIDEECVSHQKFPLKLTIKLYRYCRLWSITLYSSTREWFCWMQTSSCFIS